MKKFFALVLALVMMMSMASVSFAGVQSSGSLYVNDAALDFDADTNIMSYDVTAIQYGDTVYFNIYDEEDFWSGNDRFGGDGIASPKFMEKVKIKTTFEMGEDIVESVELVKMRASIDGASEFTEYFIAIKLADKAVTYDTDVVGTFEIDRKAIKGEDVGLAYNLPKVDGLKVDFEFPVFYTRNWVNDEDKYLVEDEVELLYDKAYALKFDCDEEVELLFGGAGVLNEGTFTVDVSGQGKVFIKWNTKADEALAAANPGVDMHFVNFNDVKFNRTGEFMYEMEDGVAAYVIHDGVVTKMADCYDASEEAFVFNTNVLCNYVFANAELVIPA